MLRQKALYTPENLYIRCLDLDDSLQAGKNVFGWLVPEFAIPHDVSFGAGYDLIADLSAEVANLGCISIVPAEMLDF